MTEPELETALVVEVPAAEHVVGQFRAQLDANALLGVPAHITILAPFMPAGRIDAGTLADLESLASGIEAFDFCSTARPGSEPACSGSGREIRVLS